jgi:hypothetical protein
VSNDEASMPYRASALFGLGLSVGVLIGMAVGSVLALRVGSDAVDTLRGLLDRVSARKNQVNFELLLQ